MKIHLQNSGRKRNKAFSIAEVVMSTLIITIGAAGVMGCFNFSFFVMQMTRENQRATQILLERAEAIRLCKWEDVTNHSGFIPEDPRTEYYDPSGNDGNGDGTAYTVQCTISAFPDNTVSYADKMRMLTVTINWNTKSVARSRTNISFIAFDGVQNYVY